MSAHTPGPWVHFAEVSCGDEFIGVKPLGRGSDVADCSINAHRTFEERAANARLIASAPELLTAAIEAYDAMRNIWNTKGRDDDFIYDEMGSELSAGFFSLRAAIAKAKGQP